MYFFIVMNYKNVYIHTWILFTCACIVCIFVYIWTYTINLCTVDCTPIYTVYIQFIHICILYMYIYCTVYTVYAKIKFYSFIKVFFYGNTKKFNSNHNLNLLNLYRFLVVHKNGIKTRFPTVWTRLKASCCFRFTNQFCTF